MEMDEATHVQDVLITTQNLGKTTVDELASNMGKLIPTANGVNIAFDQLGAMYATVTANGVATAEATTYLNSMINELGASGSTAEKLPRAQIWLGRNSPRYQRWDMTLQMSLR